MRCANISDKECLTRSGDRPSLKQAANRPCRLIFSSTSRSSNAPTSVDTRPALNPASTQREK
jgi:hypothetical protein